MIGFSREPDNCSICHISGAPANVPRPYAMSSSGPDPPPPGRQRPILSREEIRQLIARGHKVIIVDNDVLKVDPWIQYHPGGDLAILHMVGRDATDEVKAFVTPSSPLSRSVDAIANPGSLYSQSPFPRGSPADEPLPNWSN